MTGNLTRGWLMRTRPWLFPAIAALFVLLLGLAVLGLLWGTLAGAATALSDGVVTTDRQFVSPDSTNIASVDRTVGVTLTNLDLNIPLYVGTGPDGHSSAQPISLRWRAAMISAHPALRTSESSPWMTG